MDYFNIHLSREHLNGLPNLTLAHVGDGVYDLMVRSMLASENMDNVHVQHRKTVQIVAATSQARAAEKLMPVLTNEEVAVFHRGRNAKVHSVPHGATVKDYHLATGLETLFGYLYLSGNKERVNQLFEIIVGEDNGA